MNRIKELRKQLHEILELSGHEIKTSETLKNFIVNNTRLQIADKGCYFYAVHYEGDQYKNVAFRADMDALPGERG